jgi:hypothetical protein
VAVGTAFSLVLALLVWIAIPAPTHSSSTSTGSGPLLNLGGGSGSTPQSGSQTAANGGTTGAVQGGTPTGSGPSASSTGPGGTATTIPVGGRPVASGGAAGGQSCSSLTPVKVGVVIPNVGSGSASVNSTFGIPSAQEEQADYEAAFDSINKAGGVGCHTLVGDYQVFNETDSSGAQAGCTQFHSDKVFAILGGWLPVSNDNCALGYGIPVIEQIAELSTTLRQYAPYALSAAGELDLIFHNFAHAVANAGYFSASKGFKKVGIFYRDCIPGEYQILIGQLESVGVPSSAIVGADIGCPFVPFAPPNQVEQAVLTFQQQGVTDVIPMNEYEDLQAFTRDANNQGFKPQYLVADDGIVSTSGSPTFAPQGQNFDGAVAITAGAFGAISSGLPETAPTKECDQIMTSHHLPRVYQSGDGFAGSACSLVWMVAAGIAHDTSLSQAGLAPGLAAAGSVAFSYPDGPANFAQSNGFFGGEEWRPLQYQAGCACWKVTNPNFSPSFP